MATEHSSTGFLKALPLPSLIVIIDGWTQPILVTWLQRGRHQSYFTSGEDRAAVCLAMFSLPVALRLNDSPSIPYSKLVRLLPGSFPSHARLSCAFGLPQFHFWEMPPPFAPKYTSESVSFASVSKEVAWPSIPWGLLPMALNSMTQPARRIAVNIAAKQSLCLRAFSICVSWRLLLYFGRFRITPSKQGMHAGQSGVNRRS